MSSDAPVGLAARGVDSPAARVLPRRSPRFLRVVLLVLSMLMLSLQLRPSVDHEIWEDGRRLPKTLVETGSTSFFDLRRAVIASSMRPFHSLNFVFPLRALDETTAEELYRFELGGGAQQGVEDAVIRALGTSLLPALERPRTASRLFIDHVLFALRAHVAARFGAPADR